MTKKVFIASVFGVVLPSLGSMTVVASPDKSGRAIGIDMAFGETVRQAVTAIQAKKFDEAIAKLTAALGMKPDPKNAAIVHALRARAFLNENNLTKAQEDAETAVRLDSGCADCHRYSGLVYRRQNKNKEAIAEYNIALRLRPASLDILNDRGVAYSNDNQSENAIRDFDEVLRRNPNYVDAYTNRGATYDEAGERVKALADYNEAVRRKPDADNVYYDRGGLLFSMGKDKEALVDLVKAGRADREDPTVHLVLARLYWKLKMNGPAFSEYRTTTALSPRDGVERTSRAKAFFFLRDYRAAEADFALANHQFAHNAYILENRAWFAATCPNGAFRNGPQALRDAREACEFTHWTDADQLDTYAAACAEVGNFKEAIRSEEQAIKLTRDGDTAEKEQRLVCYRRRHPYRETFSQMP